MKYGTELVSNSCPFNRGVTSTQFVGRHGSRPEAQRHTYERGAGVRRTRAEMGHSRPRCLLALALVACLAAVGQVDGGSVVTWLQAGALYTRSLQSST